MIQKTVEFIQKEAPKQAREITDKTETEPIKKSEVRETVARSTLTGFGGYTEPYVKGLEKEIIKLTKENLYFKSDKYRKEILPKDYIQELEDKINELTEKNNHLLTENNHLLTENNHLLKENLYFLSDEYQNKILANSFKEKESMLRKIGFLSLLVWRLSCKLMDKEDILATLKEVLKYNE